MRAKSRAQRQIALALGVAAGVALPAPMVDAQRREQMLPGEVVQRLPARAFHAQTGEVGGQRVVGVARSRRFAARHRQGEGDRIGGLVEAILVARRFGALVVGVEPRTHAQQIAHAHAGQSAAARVGQAARRRLLETQPPLVRGDTGQQRGHALAGRTDVVQRMRIGAVVVTLGDDGAVAQHHHRLEVGAGVAVPAREHAREGGIGRRLGRALASARGRNRCRDGQAQTQAQQQPERIAHAELADGSGRGRRRQSRRRVCRLNRPIRTTAARPATIGPSPSADRASAIAGASAGALSRATAPR